jgi:hypothetical protein
MFDLEDEGSERSLGPKSILPLIEQPAPSHRAQTPPSRTQNAAGLPGSFSALQPASLPVTSHIRPPRSHQGVDSSSQAPRLAALPTPILRVKPRRTNPKVVEPSKQEAEEEQPLDPHEAEILKLVAANTPSHRGAWKRDSKAWQTFFRRQGTKGHSNNAQITEEGEGSDEVGQAFGVSESSRFKGYDEENEPEDNPNGETSLLNRSLFLKA